MEIFDELRGAAPDFRLRHANHAQGGNFIKCGALVALQGGFKRCDGELVDAQSAKNDRSAVGGVTVRVKW